MGRISVVIPVYNRQHLICDTLASIEMQQLLPYEVVVVNDGSTDRVAETVRRYARRSSLRIRCVDNYRKRGVSGATNCGIDLARGEYIALQDSDDLWTPGHLDRLMKALQRYPQCAIAFSAAAFFGNAQDGLVKTIEFEKSVHRCLQFAFDAQEDKVWLSNGRLLEALLLWGVPFRCPASLIRRGALLNYHLLFDEDIGYTQDAQFLTFVAWHTPFIYIDIRGLLIRRHAENDGDARYGDQVFRSYDARVVRMKQYYGSKKLNADERKALTMRLATIQRWAMILRSQDRSVFWKAFECLNLMLRVPCLYSAKSIAHTIYHRWSMGK